MAKKTTPKHAAIHIGTYVDTKASTDLRAGIKQVIDSAAGDAVKIAALQALTSQFTSNVTNASVNNSTFSG